MTDTKTCRRCGEDKPLDDFRDHNGSHAPKDRKQSNCRSCENETRNKNRAQGGALKQQAKTEIQRRLVYAVVPAGPWTEHRNCRGVDPDLFFPKQGASVSEAREVCRGCTVRLQCLEYALANREKYGIWGGLTELERRRIRIRRNRQRRGQVAS